MTNDEELNDLIDSLFNAYPVDDCVYAVYTNSKLNFFQDPWGAFHSKQYHRMGAKIIRVPITPVSNSQQTIRKLDLMTDGNPIYPTMENDLNKFLSKHHWEYSKLFSAKHKTVMDYIYGILLGLWAVAMAYLLWSVFK